MENCIERKNQAELTEHKVLKTIAYVLDNANEHLTCDELDKLNKCWHALKNVHKVLFMCKQTV